VRLAACIAACLLAGCASDRDRQVADLAATQWEAAAAIRAGVPPDAPAAAIQASAAAQLRLLRVPYTPAGVIDP
jgi:hypothetical protein